MRVLAAICSTLILAAIFALAFVITIALIQ